MPIIVRSARSIAKHPASTCEKLPSMADHATETLTVDRLDRQLVHALLHDGRAPFRTLAAALGCSEQTIARRYRRLCDARALRVIVLPNPWTAAERLFLRISTQPGAAPALGRALTRRADVSWVTVATGATEVTCALRASSAADRDALLLQGLPRASQVTGVVTLSVLQVHDHGPETEWHGLPDPLSREQLRLLGPGTRPHGRRRSQAAQTRFEVEDEELLRILATDGRASYARLAALTGRSESATGRRLERLIDEGSAYLDVELATALLGFPLTATLWCTVEPAHLEAVGREVAAYPETAFVAATSGRTNLIVSGLFRDGADLYGFVTRRLGELPGLREIETVPMMAVLKQQGAIMDGVRLPPAA
jgi:DNA-binding Lrp family transcriptional regulator